MNIAEENKNRYDPMRIKAMKAVSNAMRQMDEEVLSELKIAHIEYLD